MKLKKLTIFGFKSFAEKIALDFDCDILAVVGPNGCGKSNIVDAFRWVMGEQSAKSFRAEKMNDILFAGSDKRKPINYAEVSLTLTEIQGKLPLPYEEITITRRLNRNNESEYLINRESVRLKDIQDLLLGSGLGKNTLSVFEQGKLDLIIHLPPLQRRTIFDEAAGIGRFLHRKKESLGKLVHVQGNYERVSDISREVEAKVKALKKQALQAKAFKENKRILQELEKKALLMKAKSVFDEKTILTKTLNSLSSSMEKKKEEVAALKVKLSDLKAQQLENENKGKLFEKTLFEKRTRLEILKSRQAEKKEQVSHFLKNEERLNKEREKITQLLAMENEQLAKAQKEQEQLQIYFKEAELEEKERKLDWKKSEESLSFLQKELKEKRSLQLEAINLEKNLQSNLQRKILRRDASVERLEKIAQAIVQKKSSVETLEEEIEEKKNVVNALSLEIDSLKNQYKKCEAQNKELQIKLEEQKEAKHALDVQKSQLLAQIGALNRLKEQRAGFSKDAKKILQESENAKSPLFGKVQPLFELIAAKKGKEKALASATHAYSFTLVVENLSSLEEILKFAEKNHLKNFSVLVKELIQEDLKDPESVANVFWKKMRTFKNGKLMEALQENKEESVSEDGSFFIDAKKVLFFLKEEANIPFLSASELKGFSENLAKVEQEILTRQQKIAELSSGYEKALKSYQEIVLRHRKKEMTHVQENFQLQTKRSELERQKKELALLSEEKSLLEEHTKELEDIEKLKLQLQNHQKKIAQFSQTQNEKEKELEKEESSFQATYKSFEKAQLKRAKLFSESQKSGHEINLLLQRMAAREEGLQKLEKEVASFANQIQEERQFLQRSVLQEKAEQTELSELTGKYKNWEEKTGNTREIYQKLEEAFFSLKNEHSLIEKEFTRITVKMAEKESGLQFLLRDLQERYQTKEEEFHQFLPSEKVSLKSIEEQIRELKDLNEKAANVNLGAIQEYEEEEKRHEFLKNQLADLQNAKTDLETILHSLESESRKIFKKTFELIRKNFLKNFQLLFNGGEADLKFTDHSDILQAGIEITARPPGKQMRSISLLSGGEKCLTALALLFSIFEVKPAPFCILDEVDAPLDDSNVGRFAAVLKQFTPQTQFIIVTHNKKTMASADALVGISMEEKGVSKLISLAFEKRAQAKALV